MTGLQWVVLSAYVRVMPDSERRRVIVEALDAGQPTPSGQRVARTLAESAGMLERGRITEHGRKAARVFLSRFPAKGNT